MTMASSLSTLPALEGLRARVTKESQWLTQRSQQFHQHLLPPTPSYPHLLSRKHPRLSVVADSESCRGSKVSVRNSKQFQKATESGQTKPEEGTGRREALLAGAALLVALGSAATCPGNADALGSSFLKDRLKERKKDTFQILLYPIEASRVQLQKVHALLDSPSLTPALYSEAKDLVQVSSRDCMPLEHYAGSQSVAAKFFEVCTFKLLVKNAVSLVDKADPKRVRAQQALVDLNRAFSELDDVLAVSLSSATSQGREQVLPVVVSTQEALDELEDGIRDALGAPPRVA
ncbi:hypothetical protein KFL_004130080 [Klebsormidium nitens]|uniref:Uncharacterized protein n=1 Tax=Klebsormidium nitens TaxID=105231 RepID=A0A1Y1IE73_KLENI|nr:hypothetical protein KFL_004130080 [Klebsormidium nitens]|eukprot:GAQ88262.1 hypothetical protein KFL_004130080 [Klebsormidium nitens]